MSAGAAGRRQHLEEMRLAIAERLSLDQARERLSSYREHQARLEAPLPAALPLAAAAPGRSLTVPAGADEDDDDRRLPWWQRY